MRESTRNRESIIVKSGRGLGNLSDEKAIVRLASEVLSYFHNWLNFHSFSPTFSLLQECFSFPSLLVIYPEDESRFPLTGERSGESERVFL